MKRNKKIDLILIVVCIISMITLAGCFMSFGETEDNEPIVKIKESERHIIVGTYESSISTYGDATLFSDVAYQGYVNYDNSEMSSLEYISESKSKTEYGINLAVMAEEIVNDLRAESGTLTIFIYFNTPKAEDTVIFQCKGIKSIEFHGVNKNEEKVSITKEIYIEDCIVNASGLNADVGMIVLNFDSITHLLRDGGYIFNALKTNNGIMINIYENNELKEQIDIVTNEESCVYLNGYDNIKFIDISDIISKYRGNKKISEWINSGGCIEIMTKYTYENNVSAPYKITNAGMYVLNIPTYDGERVETVYLPIYEETIVR